MRRARGGGSLTRETPDTMQPSIRAELIWLRTCQMWQLAPTGVSVLLELALAARAEFSAPPWPRWRLGQARPAPAQGWTWQSAWTELFSHGWDH
jgi:hypothetical protein